MTLAKACPECRREVDAEDAFCRGCGARLGGGSAETGETGGDRRQLTLMFCDLVGSTEMASRLDPEDVQSVLRLYQETAAVVVRNVEGYVAQYLGDGMLVYFGYPLAHEDDPLRAVTAALEIAAEIPALSARLRAQVPSFGAEDLSVRIGIHTGPVVIGSVGSRLRREQLASGPTVNLAARLQSIAPPGGVLISAATARRVQGVFELLDLGALQLKGIPEAVVAHRVVRRSGTQSRIATWARGSGGPLVGREELLAELAASWESARAGKRVALVLRGDAGIGKSRLVQALRHRLTGERHGWLACYASRLETATALRPITDAIRANLGLDDDTPKERQRLLLAGALADVGLEEPLLVDRIGALLEVGAAAAPAATLDERARTLEAMSEWWLRLARRQPMVIAIEDVQWLDPSTIELLTLLLARSAAEPVLFVGTMRTGATVPWPPELVRVIDVGPLDAHHVEQIVRDALRGLEVDAGRVQQMVDRSDGVPLYAEALARDLVEQVDDRIAERSIPGSLHDSLTARLDRLGASKRLAQVGALLGRAFSYDLLAAVAGEDEQLLRIGLDRLVDRQILHRDGVPPRATFVFDQALLQDAAAASMLRPQRRDEHRRIASVLRESFPDRASERPELVAHHLAEAGATDEAIPWFGRAGQRATKRAEFREAVVQYQTALDLLLGLPASPERDAREIHLLLDSSVPRSMSASFGDPAVGAAYRRAAELCRDSPTPVARQFEALYGLARYAMVASELDASVAACEELLTFSERTAEPAHALAAQITLGQVLYWKGQFARSLAHSRKALALCDRPGVEALRDVVAVHPRVSAGIFASWALWALGEADEARDLADETIAVARGLDEPYADALATAFASVLAIMLRDVARARRLSAEALAVAEKHAIPVARGQAQVTEGWARTVEDADAAGLALVQKGMALLASLGTGSGAPGFLAVLSEVQGRLGNHGPALGVAEAGLSVARQKGQNFYDAELHRLAGVARIALAGPNDPTAEASLRRSAAVAREQGARSLELRSATTLARLLGDQGHAEEAAAVLSPILATFPANRPGLDLEEARALLAELQARDA